MEREMPITYFELDSENHVGFKLRTWWNSTGLMGSDQRTFHNHVLSLIRKRWPIVDSLIVRPQEWMGHWPILHVIKNTKRDGTLISYEVSQVIWDREYDKETVYGLEVALYRMLEGMAAILDAT